MPSFASLEVLDEVLVYYLSMDCVILMLLYRNERAATMVSWSLPLDATTESDRHDGRNFGMSLRLVNVLTYRANKTYKTCLTKRKLSYLCFGALVHAATDFAACLRTIQNDESLWRRGGTDLYGNLATNASQVVGFTYPLCLEQCGSEPKPFSMSLFASQFSSYLLPWLALTAQLPYGSHNHLDNMGSAIISIGSPALSVFSLVITLLNRRWMRQRFAHIHYPNQHNAITVFEHLQQSPVRITPISAAGARLLLASLVVLPENDLWWAKAADALSFTHSWSAVNVVSIIWVVIAYGLTLASFEPPTWNIIGASVACAWVWMLAVVTAWLKLSPNCEDARLRKELSMVNREYAYVATEAGPPVLASSFSGQYAVTLWPDVNDPDDLVMPPPLSSPTHYVYPSSERSLSEPFIAKSSPLPSPISPWRTSTDSSSDEYRSIPLFNYARAFSWSRAVNDVALAFETAARHARYHIAVQRQRNWALTMDGSIHDDNRGGNASEVLAHVGLPLTTYRWAPAIWNRVLLAAIGGLFVQWATTGSAIWFAYVTPTAGLGCHSASFILYGSLATLAFALFVASTVLEQFSYPAGNAWMIRKASTILRRLGKIVAWINCASFILLCLLRFARQYDNCYCACAVLGYGNKGFQVFVDPYSTHGYFRFWIASIFFSAAASILLYLFTWANGH